MPLFPPKTFGKKTTHRTATPSQLAMMKSCALLLLLAGWAAAFRSHVPLVARQHGFFSGAPMAQSMRQQLVSRRPASRDQLVMMPIGVPKVPFPLLPALPRLLRLPRDGNMNIWGGFSSNMSIISFPQMSRALRNFFSLLIFHCRWRTASLAPPPATGWTFTIDSTASASYFSARKSTTRLPTR